MKMTPLPKLEEIFFHIRKEAQCQYTMLKNNQITESSASMVIKTPMKPLVFRALVENKDDLQCTFCNGTKHTEDTCFHMHGYPDWFLEWIK